MNISTDVPYKELTLEEKVERAITDTIGEETNTDKERIINITVEKEIAKIELNADESLTTNLTKDSMLYKSKDIFEQLDKIEGLNGYFLSWHMDLVDVKGNVFDDSVLRIWIDKGHGVTWENFNIENFDKIATSMYMHPALQK